MENTNRANLITKFIEFWKEKGSERSESQKFWLNLLYILGVENPTEYIDFEKKVIINNNAKFIDGYIKDTLVLIEHKGSDVSLKKEYKQSDGSVLTPFEQAERYGEKLNKSEQPRWIITCNFKEMLIYDMERRRNEPQLLLIENLDKELYRLGFLVASENEHIKKETEVSIKAGELVGKLYDLLIKQYKDPTNPKTLESLNMFCVRIVFCLYAEDAEIFGSHSKFHDYLKSFEIEGTRRALIDLFKILDQKPHERNPYESETLLSFPYVNGGLFADENIEIPRLTQEIIDLILNSASENFDWSEISPTIFGAVFESTLNPETRHAGGMHYTSIQNIHKVIDNLFLNDLKLEFNTILETKVEKVKKAKLKDFQTKLANLTFLDPACGSGNFLTQTYISLRKLENEIIKELYAKNMSQMVLNVDSFIQVGIHQFYGIEINDFATTVGKTALWIAESQMMKKTEEIIHINLDFLPLKSYSNIICANALTTNWEEVVPKDKLNYIMGNPPFLGARLMSKDQKSQLENVFGNLKGVGNLDFVSAWYKLSTDYIQNTNIQVALVSTNSITQGEQTAILWKPLIEKGIKINFAYRTFRWDSEASQKAAVHCVIIGFSSVNSNKDKILYNSDDNFIKCENINPYLVPAINVFVESSRKNLYGISKIDFGSMPNDGGFLSSYSTEDKDDIVKKYPLANKMFKQFMGATEFINNKTRWCLWLEHISPTEIKQVPPVLEAVKQVKELRSSSPREATKKLADTPYLFGEIRQPNSDYLLVPRVSSENRKYIPIGFLSPTIIASDSTLVIPNATLYEFGVITSNVHMGWMRAVCGRLKSDYRYSGTVVYNNFPWCSPTQQQKAKIEQTAQAILDARNLYPDSSLADLYNELTMPKELRKAHQENDRAVMLAYGFTTKITESECVAHLMKMYNDKVKNN